MLHIIYLSVIALLLIVMLGGFYVLHKRAEVGRRVMGLTGQARMGRRMTGMGGMGMMPMTQPSESDQQKQQLTDGTSQSSTQKIFNITAGNFYFVPNKITVNKGDQVTFFITNAGGVHDLVIDELGVKTPVIKTAQTVTVTFTASKTGTFTFYCSIPGHKAKGMFGTLVVQ